MATPGSGPSETDVVKVRAWSLVTEDHLTVRAAANMLGISRSTVSRYVREIAQAQDFIDLLNVAEVRVGQAVRCDEMVQLLRHRIEVEGRPAEQIVPHWLNVEKFIADLVGTRAPTRFHFDHTGSASPAAVDPRRAEAIDEAKRIVAAERAEIEARGDSD